VSACVVCCTPQRACNPLSTTPDQHNHHSCTRRRSPRVGSTHDLIHILIQHLPLFASSLHTRTGWASSPCTHTVTGRRTQHVTYDNSHAQGCVCNKQAPLSSHNTDPRMGLQAAGRHNRVSKTLKTGSYWDPWPAVYCSCDRQGSCNRTTPILHLVAEPSAERKLHPRGSSVWCKKAVYAQGYSTTPCTGGTQPSREKKHRQRGAFGQPA
jgi:hypothetical protein